MAARRRIAVVGGGIAGLAFAASCDPERLEVVVHEAEPERASAGAALGLWPAPLRALRTIGAAAAVRGAGREAHGGALFRLDGRRLLAVPRGGPLLLPRPSLLAALEAAVPPDVRRVSGAVTDPQELDADLVVGADGVRSRVRALVHPPAAQRVESPFVTLRGLLEQPPDPGDIGEYWGGGRVFGLAPTVRGSYWFTAHRSDLGPEPLDVGQVLDEASTRFADAAPVISRTLRDGGAAALATRLWTTPAMPRYARGRYLVIGDAAHASLPNLGRGAGDALVDAVTLARTLSRDGDLRRWQARRLPVTQAARLVAGGAMTAATALPVPDRAAP